ncbi:MAG TPA: phosphatidylserine decarboxylase family protein [Candidatus Hydrogenedentes bacterium]|nr:phosphatidylserine decarboxylase family protein [Candidatus Hydrogenedentota bacterium]HPC17456.1 phosphatidylserine decarboxylase family protein [Candidatus Hydrogenedentota bacterium]HRT20048.1 phosphatidylserine decarboxylase family protein [Candidatus Hydrogenedentota bacterium]HRT64888.1 phosphatidylserine decarboxylase family protein [Candidatus Hydrogenedentota bacterium]
MTKAFSAWRVGAPYYIPALLLALIFLILALRGHRWAFVGVAVCLVYGGFSLFFFRDPVRAITAAANEVVSPADGTVVAVEELQATPHYDGPCRRISIFLSVLSVHVNRAPFDGSVVSVAHTPGEFRNAMRPETTDCNEANAVRLDTPRGPMTVRQISGAIARRIVCLAKAGDRLEKGQKFGMIKFGSRTELYLPTAAEATVRAGDKVRGGSSVVARFP